MYSDILLPMGVVALVAFLPYLVAASCTWVFFFGPGAQWMARFRIPGHQPSPGQPLKEFHVSLVALGIWVGVLWGVILLTSAGALQLNMSLTTPSLTQWAAELGLLYLLLDAWWYGTHRLMHHPLFFRRVHAIHHQFRHATPWASWAQGPWEASINALPYLILPLILPLHLVSFLTLHVLITTFATLGHCGHELFPRGADHRLPFCLFNSASHHALHHRQFGSNFGSLTSLWDSLLHTHHPRWSTWFNTVVKPSQTALVSKELLSTPPTIRGAV